jgi:bifunctional DNA-binding transcriptional regulator/antitoxin component of YhaV-PrlF toxin-antitoxin module
MAIYRVMYYSTVTVGSGGRITIPQEMRDDLSLEDGATLTARLEESETGGRQLTIWKSEEEN